MVRKKVLKEEIERLEEKNKELEEENKELQRKIDFYKSQTEKYKEANKELKKQVSSTEITGKETLISNYVSNIFKYVKDKQTSKAKEILDLIFYKRKEKEFRLFKFEDEYRKEFFSPARETESGNNILKESWLFIKHKNEERAALSQKIQNVIMENRKKTSRSVNIPATKKVKEYILIKEVVGPDLFEFYKKLNKKYEAHPKTEKNIVIAAANQARIDAVIDEQLEYNAFIRTQDYGFSDEQLVFPRFEEKMLEFYTKQKINLTSEQEKKVVELASSLNKRARYPIRDGIPMNYKIQAGAAKRLLSEHYLDQIINQNSIQKKNFHKQNNYYEEIYKDVYEDAKKLLSKAFYSYDHDDLIKRSFQSEDSILSIECYASLPSLLPAEKRMFHERNAVKKLKEQGEDVSDYWRYRGLEGWIKHSRWALVRQFNPKYPDTKDRSYWQHHISMAHQNLFWHVFKRLPAENEIQTMDNIIPEQTLNELVMHADCRA